MGRFDAVLVRMRHHASDFDRVKKVAEVSYKNSTQDLRALLAKVDKYQSKLNTDAQEASDYIGFIESLEERLSPWEKTLEKVKAMKDDADFSSFQNQSTGVLAGKLDPKKPAKAQVIDRIERHLDGEMERAVEIEKNQQALIERWLKHQAKHIQAVKAVKQINDSLGSD